MAKNTFGFIQKKYRQPDYERITDIEEAKKVTCGERIEVCPCYALSTPVAIVEPDGQVLQGMELVNYLRIH